MRTPAALAAMACLSACTPLFSLLAQDPPPPAQTADPEKKARPKRPPRPGVSTPGVKRDIATLTPAAVFPIEGVPDWQVVTADAVWVSNGPKNTLHRLDARTNQITAVVTVGRRPCSGLAAGFGSVWVPNCGDKTFSRVDMKTNEVTATIPVGPANSEGGVDASPDAVWIVSDLKGVLSRVDPATNTVAASIEVAPGSVGCVYGEGSIWVSSPDKSVLTRVEAKTNQVLATIDVGPRPRFLTYGAGSVWTLNQGDGTVTRVDAKSGKVVATIEVGVPGGGGEIAYGLGRIWLTVFEIPLTEIDPSTNAVVRQWAGPGGDAVRAGHGSVWISNLRQQNVWRVTP